MDIDALAVHALDGLKVGEKLQVLAAVKAGAKPWEMDRAELSYLIGRIIKTTHWNPAACWQQAEVQAAVCVRRGWEILGLWEARYPRLLSQIHQPPFLLFGCGVLPANNELLVGVVGTRYPSEDARLAAWHFGASCPAAGIGLVSGLAYGIDGAAHAGVLRQRGRTVAVLPGGLDRITPRGNQRLVGQILEYGGCLLSEAAPGTDPVAWRFVVRNRIIAGLTPATVVVEAPVKSGALLTAQYALDEGRDVWVHPVGCNPVRGGGTTKLRDEGAGEMANAEELGILYGATDTGV